MDASRAIYDKNGLLVCPSCAANNQIAEGDARAVSSLLWTAIGVLVGGVLSVTCINPVFIVSIVTLMSGIGWLAMIARAPVHRKKMGTGKFVASVLAVGFGLSLASIPILMVLFGTAFALGHGR